LINMNNTRKFLYILVPLFALIIGFIFITGCAQDLPGSSFGSSDLVSDTSDAVTMPLSSGLLTYENAAYKFRIGYPQNWQAREADPNNMGLVYGMLPPEENANNPLNYLVVQVEALPAGAALAQYTQELDQTMRQSNANLQILSTKATTLGGNPANELVISSQENYNKLKVLKVYSIKEGNAYIITYNILEENYDYYLETAREVIGSFEFMGTEKTIPSEPLREIKDVPESVSPGPNVSEMNGVEAEIEPEITDEVVVQIAALKDEYPAIRAEAAKALGELKDPRAVDPLIEALRDDDINTTVFARISLGEIGSSAVDPLIQALQDKDYQVRSRAAYALGLIEDDRAVEPLIKVLSDDDWVVRENAAEALGMIRDERAVEPLIKALLDEEWLVRENAAEALGKVKDGRAVEPLILATKDDDYLVRKKAAESLGEIGDLRAVEALKEALNDENSSVQSVAKEALAKIENDR
jgi:hypothetical protein